MIRPLRDRLLVERMPDLGHRVRADGEVVTGGGIIVPATFVKKSPGDRIRAKGDTFRVRVVAVGPEVRDVEPGNELLVFTFADESGKGLYTGTSTGEGLFIRAEDVVCVVDAAHEVAA